MTMFINHITILTLALSIIPLVICITKKTAINFTYSQHLAKQKKTFKLLWIFLKNLPLLGVNLVCLCFPFGTTISSKPPVSCWIPPKTNLTTHKQQRKKKQPTTPPENHRPRAAPICLPEKNEDFLGKFGWAAGWGALNPGSRLRPKTLQAVDVPVLDNRWVLWASINNNVPSLDRLLCDKDDAIKHGGGFCPRGII